ncbi:MAG: methyltransferase domain-containing protein [Thiotrichales bacterium]|jgi:ubiquinone/menaquinone biosynthesis C-methylase UbiE|nr:methyltransferase domain-containing protein [Thiotrichales bacterium]MBT3613280.1 methyltransferase domain-containing protein [Thiotrichales bacterium]MBT3751815.1 methyltransferase domain-containing protein [Thiotrichales bacterium]MBT3838054.1 methyltransferase domain-containing protein [Thiotrichales bacterium]MBT4152033.1 methyltransferase domain-containing protein [Thiotrichales bacterium]
MHDEVKKYYGEILVTSNDLQTDACSTGSTMPAYLKEAMADIHDEVAAKYYGCGLVAPQQLQGMNILDLGSGSGRDCFLLARLTGESGSVVGVDMTDAQLEVANQHIQWHADRYGYSQSNVTFHKGYIEKLDELGLEDERFDIIVSNCVINLSPDKAAVLQEAWRLLKPGGELYFSDVYSERRVPEALVKDPLLYGECLSGALYWNDFLTLAKESGFSDPRLVEDRPLTIDNPEIEKMLGTHKFYSATYRLFKIEALEGSCEEYGQAVRYRGTVEHHPDNFELDSGHNFEKGKIEPVCGNSYRMLNDSRFSEHFDFYGDWSTHYGVFLGCGTEIPFDQSAQKEDSGSGGSCC